MPQTLLWVLLVVAAMLVVTQLLALNHRGELRPSLLDERLCTGSCTWSCSWLHGQLDLTSSVKMEQSLSLCCFGLDQILG